MASATKREKTFKEHPRSQIFWKELGLIMPVDDSEVVHDVPIAQAMDAKRLKLLLKQTDVVDGRVVLAAIDKFLGRKR